jgi:hypothetical protein
MVNMGTGASRQDIDAAKQRMQATLGVGRELKRLTDRLVQGETVQFLTPGTSGARDGLLALTNRRLIFLVEGLKKPTIEDFSLNTLSSVSRSPGLVLSSLTLHFSTSRAEVRNIRNDGAKELVACLRARLKAGNDSSKAPSTQSSPAVETSRHDPIRLLRQLGRLKDAEMLTLEEFEVKKAELLRRI